MRLPALLACIALSSCAGYQLDGAKPSSLAGVETIAVPMFANRTLHPRAETLATSSAAEAFVLDGTYRVGGVADADAILQATIEEIDYQQFRATRLDTLRPVELGNTVVLVWTLRDNRGSNRLLASGTAVGRSRFFVDSNLQTSRNNALPDAFDQASQVMVSRLANGF